MSSDLKICIPKEIMDLEDSYYGDKYYPFIKFDNDDPCCTSFGTILNQISYITQRHVLNINLTTEEKNVGISDNFFLFHFLYKHTF